MNGGSTFNEREELCALGMVKGPVRTVRTTGGLGEGEALMLNWFENFIRERYRFIIGSCQLPKSNPRF
jgi:hypothetical protein